MAGGYGNQFESTKGALGGLLRWAARLAYPPMPTLNVIPSNKLSKIRELIFRPGHTVIDVGSGLQRGSGRRLWEPPPAQCKVLRLDIFEAPHVDITVKGYDWPIDSNTVDAIVLQAVLEHVDDPARMVAEAFRALKSGGYLYIEMPFLQGFHADPNDFQRFTLPGLRRLTGAFKEICAGVSVGPVCSLVWILRDGVSSIFKNRWLYLLSRFAVGWALAPLRYLDYLLRGTRAAERLACEYYILLQK